MTEIERQGMIYALLLDDVRIIKKDLFEDDDPEYLMFLLEERVPYREWKDWEIEEAHRKLSL